VGQSPVQEKAMASGKRSTRGVSRRRYPRPKRAPALRKQELSVAARAARPKMKRVGPASGSKPRFRADKPRRSAGGTSAPQDTLPQNQVASTATDDENRRLLRGARDIMLGDGYATAAAASALGVARQPGLWKAFLAPAATYAIPPMLGNASDRWSTPEAEEAASVMYQGPTGGFAP
jgi:hypothetical protein